MGVGEWLRRARDEAGLSLSAAHHRLIRVMPEWYTVDRKTIERAEKGEREPNPVWAIPLAEQVYGKDRSELPPHLKDVADVLSPPSRCTGTLVSQTAA